MIRERLKSSSGCATCRARRKKCDETRPNCRACLRLGRPCSYENPASKEDTLRSEEFFRMPVLTEDFISSLPDTESEIPARTADYSVWWQTISSDEEGIVKTLHCDPTNALASTATNLESVVISGVLNGWASLSPSLDIPQCVVDMDKCFQSTGHGIIARIVFTWAFCLLHDYINSKGRTPLSSNLPIWALTRPGDLDAHGNDSGTTDTFDASTYEQTVLMHMPWPNARMRMLRESDRYCNDRFMRKLFQATRFIWPFPAADAIYMEEGGTQRSFSAELLLRVRNLRSFTVTKDFLETHTELRGEMPQFEPSPTWYRPEEQQRWEAVYWAKLREERSRRRRMLRQT